MAIFRHIRRTIVSWIMVSMILSGLNSCNNDLEVAAPWKEVLVVYGLLNPTDAVNYIKINKAYLNESGNAIQYAAESDSLQPDSLDVRVLEFINGSFIREVVFERVDADSLGVVKDPGIFAGSPNVLYRSDYAFKPSNFLQNFRYDLYITNTITGNKLTSSCNSLGSVEVFSPLQGNRPVINFGATDNSRLVFQYLEGRNAKAYDLKVFFRYEEWNVNDSNNRTIDSIEWNIVNLKETINLRGFQERIVVATGKVFFDLLAAKLKANPDVKRRPIAFDFYFLGGGEDLYTFINVNRPSLGIVQKKPEFSNIEGGLGIFDSRHIWRYPNVALAPEMIARLAESDITAPLNFTY